ncbi:hypothetical protein [Dictyobacter vulcani]|uniref:hypothetical protein n=1 Tax=Dictyobacter vulcani TaxID=2607529 RepID=UPI001E4D1CD1|nr:hypothetical protein [Dictyobacter vulcani]
MKQYPLLQGRSYFVVLAGSSCLMACSTCWSGISRTQGWAGSSSGVKSKRPQGIAGQSGQRWVASRT